MPNITLKEFLYKFTAVPQKFIDEYYQFYELCNNNIYGIPVENIIKYLGLTNQYMLEERIRKSYKLNIDYVIIRENKKLTKGSKDAHYMISFETFERICLSSTTKKGSEYRDYFVMLRKFIDYYKNHISDKILELTKTNKYIYILAVNKRTNIFKVGRTGDIRKRLQSYSTGKETHPDIQYIQIVEDDNRVENCIKLFSKTQQYKGHKELYKIHIDNLKDKVFDCAKLDYKSFNKSANNNIDTYIVYDDTKTVEFINLTGNTTGFDKTFKKHSIKKKTYKSVKTKKHRY